MGTLLETELDDAVMRGRLVLFLTRWRSVMDATAATVLEVIAPVDCDEAELEGTLISIFFLRCFFFFCLVVLLLWSPAARDCSPVLSRRRVVLIGRVLFVALAFLLRLIITAGCGVVG